ncbi:DUF397 domain-containing protein [Streptomyces paromomycinus]|uniref:Toxin n=1 Tax=Streptomyces paromomycinus TaxID=92743 RepID=A0A401W815_STREY|nr:DUF397 domain-containing protein [Streptomyces paromomycinus]GCD45490.1 toxin [Streptomyces paromomycinus]
MEQSQISRPTGGWRKSSWSNGDGGHCLEVMDGCPNVPVRDSKAPDRAHLAFSTDAWSHFISAVKDGTV